MTFEIRLFGGFEVRLEGKPLPSFRSRRGQWLLTLLVLRQDRDTARDWLATTLWPENDETQALFYLRKSLSSLRQSLGTEASRLLSPTPRTVRLNLEGVFADVVAFDSALKRACVAADPTALLQEAVSLYRGPLLTDCEEEWALGERNQREQAYLTALETLGTHFSTQGEPANAVHWLRLLVAADPYRESAHASLMKALADCGDQVAVTVVYQELRSLLRRELNIAPSLETEAIYRQVSQQERPTTATLLPSSPPRETRRHLPVPLSDLVGRKNEMAKVLDWLNQRRLVTLLGAGGIGKTRLAIAVAEAALPRFEQGVWFVDLAALTDATLVPQTTAKALGIAEQPGRPLGETLAATLAPRSLLLVLDNCEHLLEACATLAYDLLSECPALHIIATSRQALDVMGEQVYRVPSLLVPPHESASQDKTAGELEMDIHPLMEYEAIQLFVERASRVSSTFRLHHRNAGAVVEICRQLDGIPLAIEMAAARLRSMSVSEINSRLDNRFRLLTSGNRGVLPRHQTLRAAIDWSYDQLTEAERILLCRLSVFAGGWTLEAAESVCENGDDYISDTLASLVDKSLVLRQEKENTVRYGMLEMIRQYAQERLTAEGEPAETRQRHRDYFVTLAEKIEPNLRGAEQSYYHSLLEEERDNLRTALSFCQEASDGAEPGLRLGSALWVFWADRGYLREGLEHLHRLLLHAETLPPSEQHVNVLNGAGVLTYLQSDYAAASALHEKSLAMAGVLGYRKGMAGARNGLGNAAMDLADYARARTNYEESLAIQRELGNRAGIAIALGNLGKIAYLQGDYATARTLQQECLTLYRDSGDTLGISRSLYHLAIVAFCENDYPLSRSLAEESLAIRRELGNRAGVAEALNIVAIVANETGDYASARALHEEGLAIQRAVGNKWGIAAALLNLGGAMKYLGDTATARSLSLESLTLFKDLGDIRSIVETLEAIAALSKQDAAGSYSACLWGATAALREQIGAVLPPAQLLARESEMAIVRETMGEEAFVAAWDAGHAMTMEEAIAFALVRSD